MSAHLLEHRLAGMPPRPDQLASATMAAFRRLQGLNAIAVLDVQTRQLAAAKSGSPLVLGWSEHGHMLASDYSALLEHTRRVTFVEDRQAVVLCGDTIRLFDADSGRQVAPQITQVEWEAAATELSGYPDFMTSSLWRMAGLAVPLGAGPERCVLAIKSFTAKLAILLMAAHALAGRADCGAVLVRDAAEEIERLLTDGRRDAIRQIADALHRREHLFVIGRGPSYPLALEAALKVKEVSYIHAEGFAGGDLKHGAIALIEPGTPCLVLAPRDETYDDILSGALQVKARGGVLIGVSSEPHEAFDYHIPVADLGPATAIVNAPPAQILGYYLALLRGHDPDKRRNLAKSVTVK